MRSRNIPRLALPVWNRLPAVLAFALLLYQLAIPWSVAHFATQDGPSHVYSATVFWDLLLHHKTSVYSPFYTVQHDLIPNWTSTLALAIGQSTVGAANTERLFVTLAFLTGFLAWCYARRALDPGESPWTPVANFLYQTWFLWIGFFNFYLGIALVPVAIGLYARKDGWLNLRRAAALALVLLAIYATHLIAAAVALATMMTVGFWLHIAVPVVCGENAGRRWLPPRARVRQFGLLLLATAPAIILMVLWAAQAEALTGFDPRIAWAWHEFPMHIFLTAGADAKQPLLWKSLLAYAALAALLLKKREWASAKGGLVLATLVIFGAYLLVPDRGFGGGEAKIRFSWAVFVLAGLVAYSASRLRFLHVPVAILFAWSGCLNSIAAARTASAIGDLIGNYLAVAGHITPGASFVRLRYPAPELPARYGFEGVGRDPVFHLDALAAAGRRELDLSDYEALNRIFPVIFKPYIEADQQSVLWSFEGPDPTSDQALQWIDDNFPVPIDFVLVVGDSHSSEAARMGMPKITGYLDSTMRPVAASPDGILRLYERRCEAAGANSQRTAGRACAP